MGTAMAGAAKDIHQEQPVRTYSGFVALAIGIALLVLAGWLVNDILANVRARVPISFAMLATTVARGDHGGARAARPLHAAAERGGDHPAVRRVSRHDARTWPARDQSVLHAQEASLRARNLNGERLKVNDKRGNPIEIAAVVVWRVDDTAKAVFDVDNYENYVKLQAEAAVRHLASSFAYDDGDRTTPTPPSRRCSPAPTSSPRALVTELQERLEKAGVIVEEARLTHLAYAPEIAQVMLRRQQAEAIIAARKKIVHGAVSMVQMALNELSAKQVVELDDERKAAMVSNLMTVLCAESEVQPVINTGTLYA